MSGMLIVRLLEMQNKKEPPKYDVPAEEIKKDNTERNIMLIMWFSVIVFAVLMYLFN